MSKLSNNIKNLRVLRGLSQKQLADMIDRSPNTISNWEKGSVTPDADVLEPLCEIFKVNPNQLFGWETCQELEDFLQEKEGILLEMNTLQLQRAAIDANLRELQEKLNRRQ
jgi:transcriptional regulator with XRE-family HTH domain